MPRDGTRAVLHLPKGPLHARLGAAGDAGTLYSPVQPHSTHAEPSPHDAAPFREACHTSMYSYTADSASPEQEKKGKKDPTQTPEPVRPHSFSYVIHRCQGRHMHADEALCCRPSMSSHHQRSYSLLRSRETMKARPLHVLTGNLTVCCRRSAANKQTASNSTAGGKALPPHEYTTMPEPVIKSAR